LRLNNQIEFVARFGREVVVRCSGPEKGAVSETRKLAAILVADIVGYSRLAGADEDRFLARLRTLRSDLSIPQSRSITAALLSGRATAASSNSAASSMQ
jgi:class 3 adenylate cyclase